MPRPALRSPLLGLSILLAAHGAHAAPEFINGPLAPGFALCGGDATEGVETEAGYAVDPVAQAPRLGQVTIVHAVAANTNCVGDEAVIELFLPPGASFAISAGNPVRCFTSDGSQPAECLQQPVTGLSGGAEFGRAFLASGRQLEIQVPVVFNQLSDNASLVVHTTTTWGTFPASVGVTVPFQPRVPQGTRGDDLALIGSAFADPGTLPIAFSNDNGTFTMTNYPVGDFAAWARAPGVKRLSGDFNHDGLTDYALVGGPGWNTIPIALSQGNGRFTITNSWVGDFGAWAATANVTALAGDFNHDGYTDIALVGGVGWAAVPVAFSTGNGNFRVTNDFLADFPGWAAASGVRPMVGDFNKDGFADIALVGGPGWNTLPIAFSYGNGTFLVTNNSAFGWKWGFEGVVKWNFAAAAREAGVQVIAGDFNKDGFTDLAVVGGVYGAIRLAMNHGGGQFVMSDFSQALPDFSVWASTPGVQILAGDFNNDGATDIALTGVPGWGSIPVAFSSGNPNFVVTNMPIGAFPGLASQTHVRAVVGDFNGDGFSDIALVGGAGWTSIPVALNVGNGYFIPIFGVPTPLFPSWATDPSATVMTGQVNQ